MECIMTGLLSASGAGAMMIDVLIISVSASSVD